MDTVGNKVAREITAAPNMALRVIDLAIQAHGGGVSEDFGRDVGRHAHAAPTVRTRCTETRSEPSSCGSRSNTV
jgi:hypothetical protein